MGNGFGYRVLQDVLLKKLLSFLYNADTGLLIWEHSANLGCCLNPCVFQCVHELFCLGSIAGQKNVLMLSREIRLLSMPSRSVSISMASPRS
jgi:hypothetical protein